MDDDGIELVLVIDLLLSWDLVSLEVRLSDVLLIDLNCLLEVERVLQLRTGAREPLQVHNQNVRHFKNTRGSANEEHYHIFSNLQFLSRTRI